jgi:hypothetical protein
MSEGPKGGGAAYKGRVDCLGVRAKEGKRARAAAGRTRPRVRPGTRRVGDDRWSPPVIDRGSGRRRSGLAAMACWADWARRKVGLRCGGVGRGLLAAAG